MYNNNIIDGRDHRRARFVIKSAAANLLLS